MNCGLGVAVLSIFVWAVGVVASFGAEYEQNQGSAAVRLLADKIDAGRVEIRLSDEVLLTVSVEGGKALEVQPYQPLTMSADWEVRPGSAPEKILLAAGRVRWSQQFRLLPLKPGEQPLSLAPLRYRPSTDAENWEEVAWRPIPVNVTTEVYRAGLSELRDVAPPEELPPAPSWGVPLTWAGLALVTLLVLLSGWAIMRRRRPRNSILPPHEWAARELRGIDLPANFTDRDLELFYLRLSDVLRRYVELRYHVPAPEQTTAEFLASLRRAPELRPEQQALLSDFLERCDLVKFARAQPSAEECRAVAQMARAFVEQTAMGKDGAIHFSGGGAQDLRPAGYHGRDAALGP